MPPALKEYEKKRDFARTPEPPAQPTAPETSTDLPRFVVQKHQASHQHYDFRIEVDGVLKSWSVPKGPSLDPGQKRLAMQTEDHPFDYRNFEGVIPEGNYGAGAVMLWDEGTYTVAGATDRAQIEKTARRDLERGRLHLILQGQKLKGEFVLAQMKKDERGWLLFKKDDAQATIDDILTRQNSVRTGRTMDEIREQRDAVWSSNRKAETPARHTPTAASNQVLERLEQAGARHAPMPTDVEPMLATLADEPFDRAGWYFEIKWDGFRAVGETHHGSARLYSRHNQDYASEFAAIARELEQFPYEAVMDGEIVVVDENGKSSFKLLQAYRQTGKGILLYYVFDLIYLEGYDLRALPLDQRKAMLKELMPVDGRIRYSDHVERDGVALYKQAREFDVEGIIGKNKASQYRPGVRSSDWLKVKTHLRQEAVIGGFTEPRGGRKNLGALLLGVYEGKDFVYVGHTGGGFDEQSLAKVRERLQPLVRAKAPFKTTPKTNAPATWVEPRLVCEVRFADWTHDGLMRQPIFLGLREDKEPRQVRRERAVPIAQALAPKRYMPRIEQQETVHIDGHEIALTNPHKVFWPEEGITKKEVIEYYRAVAPFILPHLKGRPLSLHRFPNGIQGKGFFQKDFRDDAPEWVTRVRLEAESEGGAVEYVVCQDEATLVYLANLATLEFNPWLSRVQRLDNPDVLLLDLDPHGRPFTEVVRLAQTLHAILDEIAAPNFVKTSGQSGLHIVVPLAGRYTYAQSRQFAQLIMRLVNEIFPDITSLERSPSKREGKIYLDYMQNRQGQTMAAPYSLRPRPGAPVSTPLRWEQVTDALSPAAFNLHSIPARVRTLGDLWQEMDRRVLDMPDSLARLKGQWTVLQAMRTK